jgi:catechol 2,3-dioxygenase-like lactoylglutathione lyase family enzyme
MKIADGTVVAMIAVKELAKAKQFYSVTLGLKQGDENPGGVAYVCGTGKVFVYESQTAGTGQATCATWEVSDVEGAVAELKEKGLTFEHYDIPGAEIEGDVHVMGPMKAAWFKDPDGNILGLANAG